MRILSLACLPSMSMAVQTAWMHCSSGRAGAPQNVETSTRCEKLPLFAIVDGDDSRNASSAECCLLFAGDLRHQIPHRYGAVGPPEPHSRFFWGCVRAAREPEQFRSSVAEHPGRHGGGGVDTEQGGGSAGSVAGGPQEHAAGAPQQRKRAGSHQTGDRRYRPSRPSSPATFATSAACQVQVRAPLGNLPCRCRPGR